MPNCQGVLTFTDWWYISWNGLSFTGTLSGAVELAEVVASLPGTAPSAQWAPVIGTKCVYVLLLLKVCGSANVRTCIAIPSSVCPAQYFRHQSKVSATLIGLYCFAAPFCCVCRLATMPLGQRWRQHRRRQHQHQHQSGDGRHFKVSRALCAFCHCCHCRSWPCSLQFGLFIRTAVTQKGAGELQQHQQTM